MDHFLNESENSSEVAVGVGLVHYLVDPEERQILKYDDRDDLFLFLLPVSG